MPQKVRIEVRCHVFIEESVKEKQSPEKTQENSVLLELVGVQFEEIEQIESFRINPQPEKAHYISQMVVFNKVDMTVPNIDVETLV